MRRRATAGATITISYFNLPSLDAYIRLRKGLASEPNVDVISHFVVINLSSIAFNPECVGSALNQVVKLPFVFCAFGN